MAPAGVFWAAARAVAFCCARGKGGGAIVRLGAKEGGKGLGQGRNVGGGRSADGGELRRARGRFWPFNANQGRKGRRFGGRWRAALMAGRGQRLGRCTAGTLGATAASRRVAECSSLAERSSIEQRAACFDGTGEGRSAARRAGEHSRPGIEHGGSGAARHARRARVPALRAGEGQRGRERGKRERERRGKKKSTA